MAQAQAAQQPSPRAPGGHQASGGFQGFHFEFGGQRPNARSRQPTAAEKEAMEVRRGASLASGPALRCARARPSLSHNRVAHAIAQAHMKAVNDEMKEAIRTAAKQAAAAVGNAVANAAMDAAKRTANSAWDTLISPFKSGKKK